MSTFRLRAAIFGGVLLFASNLYAAASSNNVMPSTSVTSPLPPVSAETSTTSATTDVSSTNNGTRLWNLENADIRSVIDAVAKETGKNFVIDPRVQGKVTLISSVPMNADEIYQVFLAILQTHGFAAIPSGNIIKIVPDTVAKFQEIPTIINNENTGGANLVVTVIPVEYSVAAQLVPVLRPMLPPSSDISAYTPANSLIISASANKIAQIAQIVHQLDHPDATTIEIVPLHYATANDVANTLKPLLRTGTGDQGALMISADTNSNSILVTGAPQDRIRIKQLVEKMDKLAANAAEVNNTAVVHLRYLNAKDFAPVLQNIATGAPVATASSATPTTSTSTSASSTSGTNELSPPAITNVPGIPLNFNNANGEENNVQIEAEPDTNSIIINAPPAQLRALKLITAQLDTKPEQVLVEAIIVEVSERTLQQLGLEWGTLAPSGMAVPTDTFSSITGGLGVGIVDFGRFKSVIHALATDSSTNILSTPSVVVLDNQKAAIKVGQKVSFVTGQYTNGQSSATGTPTTTVTPFTTTDREDVALHLDVTPQISQGDTIRLLIDQGNESLRGDIVNNNPTTDESSINTSVLLDSGQILVIGGLISNDLQQNIQKVPLLGSIPVLGKLFQYRSDSLDKRNLVIFIRPMVMNDLDASNAETGQRYSMIRELQLQRLRGQDILAPSGGNEVLVPWQSPQLPQPFSELPLS